MSRSFFHIFIYSFSFFLSLYVISPFVFSTPGYLDITFIGNNYTDLNDFHNDIKRFKEYLLIYEPFKTRASEILFHSVNNTEDLNCSQEECDVSRAEKIIIDFGVPHNKIVIIANGLLRGSALGDDVVFTPVSPGISTSPEIFVHELGHTFGLLDEYILHKTVEGPVQDKCYANCCASSNCVDWQSIPEALCIKGCNYPNWYRSSESSIMGGNVPATEAEYFNIISQNIINKEIDNYVEIVPPNVSIIEPLDGARVNGEVRYSVNSSDNGRIKKVELYIDDELFRSHYSTQLLGTLGIRDLAFGSNHTLYAKAYDIAGNVDISPTITITISEPQTTEPSINRTVDKSSSNLTLNGDSNLGYNKSSDVSPEKQVPIIIWDVSFLMIVLLLSIFFLIFIARKLLKGR